MKSEQYIIAIGASAGGMEQINTFFDFTPLDGVSYIVIQHLSADYKSMMKLLLAKHSKLNIVEAANNMLIEVNKVYLIPSKNVMTVKDGRLFLTDKVQGVNLTINTFFTSLAGERGGKAIGVILSGTGSDGTEGIKAIKKAGGLLIASDPKSSEFDQMPANAIATGLVDYVIPPNEMPKVIADYVSKNANVTEAQEDSLEDEKTMMTITDLIKDKLPEDFSGYKKTTILRRIKRRASLQNFKDLDSYLDLLKNDTTELQNLAKDFLISVTTFFRDKYAFNVLKKVAIPEILQSKNEEDIKMWVAGCATGEEAYSLAILVREQLEAAKKNNTVKIFATDIDKDALQFAGKGYYNESIDKDISPKRLEKFFTREKQGYRIKPIIREMLIFAHHDLVKNPPYCNMDLISCRNMLIYITPVLQQKILDMLHFGLKYKGYLFLGASESILDLRSSLEEIDKKWKIYKNVLAKRTLNFETFISPPLMHGSINIKPQVSHTDAKLKHAEADSTGVNLLIEMGFAGVWLNENNEVLTQFGDSSKFLLPKLFTHHLPDLLSQSLQIAFTAATIEADKTMKLTVVKEIKMDNADTLVTLSVKPLSVNEAGELKRLVMFCEDGAAVKGKQAMTFDENFYTNKYTVNIKEELKVTREKLDATYELLNASNENMQSFNEEVLSANEEMQSTNEEMQSVNEELQTMNAEYQAKIRELSDLNDDLNNYFRSNLNGQLFVNKELLLMKFSPGAATHINVLENDIGRPLSNLSTNIRFETIDKDIRAVLTNNSVITKEIQATNGKWFQVMTMPYLRKGNDETDGAIISFNDISELKQIQQELALSNKSLTAINADLDNFVYTASHDLLSPINNMEQILHLIKEKEPFFDHETNEYVGMLSRAVVNTRSVIKEMAAVGRMESEMVKLETINLRELIDEILKSIYWKISSENADIQTSLEVNNISFSKKNCRSMLFNLINNALKFRSPDRAPKIVITTKDLHDYTLLTVKDNGIGINKNKIESIFRMYKRLNENAEGQGLGLFLIKKIVDASGGRVEVESEPGEGTEFKLFLKK